MAKNQVKLDLLFEAKTASAIKNLENLGKTLQEIGSNTKINIDASPLAYASDAARQLQVHLQEAMNVDTGKLDLQKLNNSLKAAGTNLSTLTNNLQEAGNIGQQAFIQLATAIASAEAPTIKINKKILDIGKTLLNTAKWQVSSSIIHGITGAMAKAVGHAEHLNDALSDIRVVTGYSAKSMASFAKEASKAAKELNTTTTEYSKAALIFYQQGLNGNAASQRAETVIKLAQVTGQSAQEVSDQMTAIWNNFDDGSKSLEYYADVITKLGAATAASTEEISAGLEKFAAIAETVGLSYETATAAVATVVDKTRQSADVVGTSFKTIFARMEGLELGETLDDGVDLNKYSQALATVGVEVLTTSGELREMDDILSDLGSKWQYLGEETKVALAQTVGGIRQYNQMLALMDNWDDVQKNINLAKNATGELTEQQKIWSDSYEAASERVKNSQENLYDSLISDKALIILQDLFSGLLDYITNIVDSFHGIVPIVVLVASLFRRQLMPAIANNVKNIANSIQVLKGKATQELITIQQQVKNKLSQSAENPNMSAAQKKQIELSQELISMKQRLAQMSKKMNAEQIAEAERRISIFESMVSEAQTALKLEDELTKQAVETKKALTSGDNSTAIIKSNIMQQHEKQLSGSQQFANISEEQAKKQEIHDYAERQYDDATAQSMLDTRKKISAIGNDPEHQAELQYWKEVLSLQEQIAIAANKTSKELAQVAAGASVDSFAKDPELANTTGVVAGGSALLQSNVADNYKNLIAEWQTKSSESRVKADESKKIADESSAKAKETDNEWDKKKAEEDRKKAEEDEQKAKADKERFENAQKMRHQTAISAGSTTIKARAVTGEEMLTKATESMQTDSDGKFQSTIENFDTLLSQLSQYSSSAKELTNLIDDFSLISEQDEAAIRQGTEAMFEYQASLEKVNEAEKAYEAALNESMQIQQNANSTSKQIKAAKEKESRAFEKLSNTQKQHSKLQTQLDKSTQTYAKQLNSLYQALQKAAASSSNYEAENKNITRIFKLLTKGGKDAQDGMKELHSLMLRLGGGSKEAADGIQNVIDRMKESLIASGMDAEAIEQHIEAIRKLGEASEDSSNKMKPLGDVQDDLKDKLLSGTDLVTNVVDAVGGAIGVLTTAQGAINGFINAFDEGNTPLETTLAILTSLAMLFPIINGAIQIGTAIKAANTAVTVAQNLAAESGEKLDKKRIKTIWAENAAESSLLVVRIMAAAVEKLGIAGVVAGIALAGVAIATTLVLTSAISANTEAKIEANQATQDASLSTQEQTSSVEELSSAVDDLTESYAKLNKEGKSTGEVLDELNKKFPELIDSYRDFANTLNGNEKKQLLYWTDELENLYNVAQFTGDYTAFNEKKEQIDNLITKEKYDNAKSGGAAGGQLAATAMEKATGGSVTNKTLKLNVGGVNTKGDGEETKAQELLSKHMGDYYTNADGLFRKGANLSVGYTSAAKFTDYYEKMQAAYNEMQATMTEEEFKSSDIAREIKGALDAGKEQYEKMLPLAEDQVEAAGKLATIALEQEGLQMSSIDTFKEYVDYKDEFIDKATKTYGITKEQAEAYLQEAEGLSRITKEYDLASIMLSRFNNINIKDVSEETLNEMNDMISEMFGNLSDEEMSIAVSIASTVSSAEEFGSQFQQALVISARQGYNEVAAIAQETLTTAISSNTFDYSALLDTEEFVNYLQELNISQEALRAKTYEEQYKIISNFHSQVKQLEYDTYTSQQELHYQRMAAIQAEIAQRNEAYENLSMADKARIDSKQGTYQSLQTKLDNADSDEEKAKIMESMRNQAEAFEKEYGFSIETNVVELQNEFNELLDKIDELQDKKIEIAMDWSGSDKVEASMAKAAEFTKIIQNETRKTGSNYVMTAKQAREWLQFYPELADIAETTDEGLIELDQTKVDAFIQGREAEVEATIQAQIDELEAQKTALDAELVLREADLKAAEAFANGEVTLENTSAEFLVEMRKNLTDYYIEAGNTEAQANELALKKMSLDEKQYAEYVAKSCDAQAKTMSNLYDNNVNVATDSLKKIGEKWLSFGKYLATNLGPLIKDVIAAALDPTKTIKDVLMTAWNAATETTPTEAASDPSAITNEVDNIGELNLNNEMEKVEPIQGEEIGEEFKVVGAELQANINDRIKEIKTGLNSINGQIDYLKALKSQSLSDYGIDSIGTEELDMMSDALERYHALTREVAALERGINQLKQAQDAAFGQDAIDLMDEQYDKLGKLLEKQEALEAAQSAQKLIDQTTAQKLFKTQFVIDDNGDISNYDALMEEAASDLDDARTTYNKTPTESNKKALEEAEKIYEERVAAIEKYEQTLDEYNTSIEKRKQIENERKTLYFEKIIAKSNNTLEANNESIKEYDHYLNKIADDSTQMAEAVGYIQNKITATQNSLGVYKTQMDDLHNDYAQGKISQADYVAGLQKAKDGMYEQLEALNSLDKEMLEYYGDTLAVAGEEIAKYTNKISGLTSVLQHYQTLLSIIGKESDYESMGIILQGIADTAEDAKVAAKAEYDMFAKQANAKKAAYEALENKDSAQAEALKKEWEAAEAAANEAQDRMLQATADWAEAMKSVVENKLKGFAKTLEEQLTGGKSFDELNTSMERASSLQEEYLTSTNQLYETQKMIRTAQKAIDETSNQAAKQKLKAFQEETKELQSKGKLSKYELDIQQAQYDLLLAEIALEEAQSAKSTVRLQRDSEGNFGYVYTADSNKVADAEQKVADAQNALYNKQLDGANDYTQKYQQTMSEMYDNMTLLQEQYLNGEIATEAEYERKMLETKNYYYAKLQNYAELYGVAIEDTTTVTADAWSNEFTSMMNNTEAWQVNVTTYAGNCKSAFIEWSGIVAEIKKTTGEDLDGLQLKVSNITTESDKLVTALTKDGGVIDTQKKELDAVSKVTEAYGKQRDTLKELIAVYEKADGGFLATITAYINGERNKVSTPPPSENDNKTGETTPPPEETEEEPTPPELETGKMVTLKDDRGGLKSGETYMVAGYDGYLKQVHLQVSPGQDQTVIVDKTDIVGFASGGYTGNWGPEGKLAVLHQKELILNSQDTENLLAAVETLHIILNTIDMYSTNAQIGGILSTPGYYGSEGDILEQHVTIEASFPGVQDRNEIEEAFNNLINRASQYANRY